MGAWIETQDGEQQGSQDGVAPLVGAWIETFWLAVNNWLATSHPSWVRGLKPPATNDYFKVIVSHPSWVRGLKLLLSKLKLMLIKSHPSWVRGLKPVIPPTYHNVHLVAPLVGAWIETFTLERLDTSASSHPSWVRGLKHVGNTLFNIHQVAPLVGAWIETTRSRTT